MNTSSDILISELFLFIFVVSTLNSDKIVCYYDVLALLCIDSLSVLLLTIEILPRFSLFYIQVEPIRNFFAALFLASIGMLIHVHFLWNHVDILLAAVILVIVIKTMVVAAVVKGFRYSNKTSILV